MRVWDGPTLKYVHTDRCLSEGVGVKMDHSSHRSKEHRSPWSKEWSTESTDCIDSVQDLVLFSLFLKDFECFLFLCLCIYRIRDQRYFRRVYFKSRRPRCVCTKGLWQIYCRLKSEACRWVGGLSFHKLLTKEFFGIISSCKTALLKNEVENEAMKF